jgi:hypothetical protein
MGLISKSRVAYRTLGTKLMARGGSIPLGRPAMMLIFPVGATVFTVALRTGRFLRAKIDWS